MRRWEFGFVPADSDDDDSSYNEQAVVVMVMVVVVMFSKHYINKNNKTLKMVQKKYKNLLLFAFPYSCFYIFTASTNNRQAVFTTEGISQKTWQ